ncbi:MAG TPA: bifunctional molybdenum cofactor biosynthesis protein MoaC/MoaB [Saprospiraceae bacterium]|nr:bifunctional molybdenum cofactor biosynthesis protein MoaC/MoaB [Saprospiraceae bacterium]
MNIITHKNITLRKAIGLGLVLCTPDTIKIIKKNQVPKGNLFEFAKAAGLLGAKQTQHLLPHCHPVAIDGMDISFEFLDKIKHKDYYSEAILSKQGIVIFASAVSIGKTGIEMEVLTGISIAALEIYDFLKPIDKILEISSIKLIEKTGGKSDKLIETAIGKTCAVLVCSDSVSEGKKEDLSGIILKKHLEDKGADVIDFQIVADNISAVQNQINKWVKDGIQYIFTSGGTGIGPRDITIEAVKEIIDKEVPGIAEAIREEGRKRTPTAIFSRSLAGIKDKTMIVCLPGSPKGVFESLNAIIPAIFHSSAMLYGKGH